VASAGGLPSAERKSAMCGRYTVFTEDEVIEMREIINEVNQRYINTAELAAMKTGEIFPTNVVPVLAQGTGDVEARLMTWGFPKWQDAGVIINARAETALEKQMFRSSLLQRRCVVPSTGFYEWKHEGGKSKKDKYLVTLPGEDMLYMAGFYNTFRDKLGKPFIGFVILTAEANDSMAPLHDRMPVVLSADQRGRWLADGGWAMELLARRRDDAFLLRKVPA
jgi:putative SOS response-associated peptidase YedK